MICTYCGRGSHTARTCPTRPVRTNRRFLCTFYAAMVLAGCSQAPPVPPARLSPPPAELMLEPTALDPIPSCDGAVDCRASYYAKTRAQYGALANRHRGLQRWVRTATQK